MSGMPQEEILRSTKTVAQGLDALKEEHEAIKSKLLGSVDKLSADERQLIEEKAAIVDKNLDSIRLGIEEAQVMMALASHLQNLEAEKQKYKAQVRRLCQENAWIRDELNSTQQALRTSEQVIEHDAMNAQNDLFSDGRSTRRGEQAPHLPQFHQEVR